MKETLERILKSLGKGILHVIGTMIIGSILTMLMIFLFIGVIKTLAEFSIDKTPEGLTQYDDYWIYRTTDAEEYIEFLSEFDEESYDIVDISTSMHTQKGIAGSDEFYIITYKVAEN